MDVELVLVGVTLISLTLAATMSVVAWRLLRQERERAAARAEALAAMAFAPAPGARRQFFSSTDEGAPLPATRPTVAVDDAIDIDKDGAESLDLPLKPSETDAGGLPLRAPLAGHGSRRSVASTSFEPSAAPAAATRWLALAAIALVIAAGFALSSALRSPEVAAAVAASREPARPSSPGDGTSLELISLRHAVRDDTLIVTGLVQNPSRGAALGRVEAIVYLFDDEGRFFAQGRAPLDLGELAPGTNSPFVIAVSGAAGVARYRVGFRDAGGASLMHVDRRGQMPRGTSGEALDAGLTPVGSDARPLGAVGATE